MSRATVKWAFATLLLLVVALVGYSYWTAASVDTQRLPPNHGKVRTELFLGSGEQQSLLVGLGGSDGGNAWASDRMP